MEEIGRHRDDAFPFALGRSDHQQGDDLSVGPLILADAEVRELGQLLDSDPAVPEDLDRGPLPEGDLFDLVQVDRLARFLVDDPDRRPCLGFDPTAVFGGVAAGV
ncbi:hypothetical protein [Streptomyces sp. NPDC089799]|uniref:hypothetical protein n=1 Tax=Streptomyces sp. NPDC089799 TaxID=3155066 RepID=UPI0034305130